METIKLRHYRRGISAIVGAVILFSMVFTTGATYFAFVALNQQTLNIELLTRTQTEIQRSLERYTPVSLLVTSTGNIGLNVTNSGDVTIKIVTIVISNSTHVFLLDGQPGQQTTPNLPIFINPLSNTNFIDTGIKPKTGQTYSIKVLSDRGNIGQTAYPEPSSSSIVAASLIAKGVGDIQMIFTTFKWATKSSTPLSWNDGSQIPKNEPQVIWKVNLTNHSEKDIFVSQNSVLAIIGAGSSNTVAWYIIKSVDSSTGSITALGSTEYIKITANPSNIAQGGPPITVYFAATAIGGATPAGAPAQADIWFVMIGLTGTYTTGGSSDKYSQLIPFKSILVN